MFAGDLAQRNDDERIGNFIDISRLAEWRKHEKGFSRQASATFTVVLGASGQVAADAGGNLIIDVPARSALVYVARP